MEHFDDVPAKDKLAAYLQRQRSEVALLQDPITKIRRPPKERRVFWKHDLIRINDLAVTPNTEAPKLPEKGAPKQDWPVCL